LQLQEIGLKRFKSLYNVKVQLGSFSMFTGPNGSGKSNLFSAVDFLGEVYRYGLEMALARAGGLDSIAYRRNRRTTVSVEFSITTMIGPDDLTGRFIFRGLRDLMHEGHEFTFKHHFGIKPSRSFGDSTFTVSSEDLELLALPPKDLFGPEDSQPRRIFAISSKTDNEDRNVEFWTTSEEPYDRLVGGPGGRVSDLQSYLNDVLSPTELIVSVGGPIPVFRDFRVALADLRVYRLNPSDCRAPGIMTPNATLERSGRNLPGVVANMRRHSLDRRGSRLRVDPYRRFTRNAWHEIVQSMAEILPGLSDIDTAINASGGLELQFIESDVGRAWSAQEVSDGTIQYLALLAVMFDRVSPVLIVEEPENALHSWLLRTFLEKCRSRDRSQVLMTTHSPVALKSAKPSEVILTWKKAGRTEVRTLTDVDSNAQTLYEHEGVDVFEQYDSGFLPQSLPGEGAK
jgi:predicted ATPase